MAESHQAIFNLGSNIEPEENIRRAIALLRRYGSIQMTSTAWESKAVGGTGPNYLNVSVSLLTPLNYQKIITEVVDPIEAALGRTRSPDKFASRTIDVDVILFDGQPHHLDTWGQSFLIVPTAELLPDFPHPLTNDRLSAVSREMVGRVWMQSHPEIHLD